ncbi:AbrB/MazE/SpoVT family DNA-binding domain-containing protein [Thermodesulfobium sp.]
MRSSTNKSVLTKKSQVTLPKQIRDFLGVKAGERISFVIEDNTVKIVPIKSKLEENFGKVKPIQKPEDFKQIREFVEQKIVQEAANEI